MKKQIFNFIEIALKNKINQYGDSEIDETVLKEKLDNEDAIGSLRELKFEQMNGDYIEVVDVTDLIIDVIHENLREVKFPNELNGFDYEEKYGTKTLVEYLEQKQKNDLELEILDNLKQYPNPCYCDVDNFILENRVEKYKVEIIQKIRDELLEEKIKKN